MNTSRGLVPTSVLRLSIAYAIVFSLTTSLLVGLLYVYAVRALDRGTDEVIDAELLGLAEQYRSGGLGALATVIAERVQTGGSPGDVYLLADPRLRPIAGNIAAWPVPRDRGAHWVEFDVSIVHGTGFESRTVRAGLFTLPDGYHLLVGADIYERETFKSRIGWTLLASVLIVIALGASLGLWMNRHVLGKVNAISAAGREIVEGNFSRRLPRSGSNDEFDALAANLNEMLDRVEHLTAALRFVIDSTAHDLRGPLNRVRARIEAALRGDLSGAGYVLEDTLKEVEALSRTLDGLLRIAQAQGGPGSVEVVDLDLGQLTAEVVELYEPLAAERRIRLRVDAPCIGNRTWQPATAGARALEPRRQRAQIHATWWRGRGAIDAGCDRLATHRCRQWAGHTGSRPGTRTRTACSPGRF